VIGVDVARRHEDEALGACGEGVRGPTDMTGLTRHLYDDIPALARDPVKRVRLIAISAHEHRTGRRLSG